MDLSGLKGSLRCTIKLPKNRWTRILSLNGTATRNSASLFTGACTLSQLLQRETLLNSFQNFMHDLMDLQDCGSRIPYAEWYLNALRIPGSATATYHEATYGTDVQYTAFQKPFEDYARSVDFGQWAEFFRTVGAKYVVMVTKHLDGYTLWPTQILSPRHFLQADSKAALTMPESPVC